MVLDRIRRIVARYIDADMDSVPQDATPEALGLESLDLVEIAMDIEDELGVELEGLQPPRTLRELVVQVAERL